MKNLCYQDQFLHKRKYKTKESSSRLRSENSYLEKKLLVYGVIKIRYDCVSNCKFQRERRGNDAVLLALHSILKIF